MRDKTVKFWNAEEKFTGMGPTNALSERLRKLNEECEKTGISPEISLEETERTWRFEALKRVTGKDPLKKL